MSPNSEISKRHNQKQAELWRKQTWLYPDCAILPINIECTFRQGSTLETECSSTACQPLCAGNATWQLLFIIHQPTLGQLLPAAPSPSHRLFLWDDLHLPSQASKQQLANSGQTGGQQELLCASLWADHRSDCPQVPSQGKSCSSLAHKSHIIVEWKWIKTHLHWESSTASHMVTQRSCDLVTYLF